MAKYKDMLGKSLVVGQTALNVFIQSKSQEPIGHRICEIIKLNGMSVRIRYEKSDGTEGQSNIYNTTNRLIVLQESDGHASGGENTIENRWEILDFNNEQNRQKTSKKIS